MIVVLEGLTCTGKTTFFKMLEKDYPNFVYLPEVATLLAEQGIDVAERTSLEVDNLFMEKYRENHIKAHEVSKNGNICVLDRNYISSLTYAYVKFLLSQMTDASSLTNLANLIQQLKEQYRAPHFYIHLSANPSVIKERTTNRNNAKTATNLDSKMLKEMQKFYQTIRDFSETNATWMNLDTSVGSIKLNYHKVQHAFDFIIKQHEGVKDAQK